MDGRVWLAWPRGERGMYGWYTIFVNGFGWHDHRREREREKKKKGKKRSDQEVMFAAYFFYFLLQLLVIAFQGLCTCHRGFCFRSKRLHIVESRKILGQRFPEKLFHCSNGNQSWDTLRICEQCKCCLDDPCASGTPSKVRCNR